MEEEVGMQKDGRLFLLPSLTCIRSRCGDLASKVRVVPSTATHVMCMTTSVLSVRAVARIGAAQ